MQVFYEKLTLNEQQLFLFKDVIQPVFTSPYHWHDEYELIYIQEGSGKLFVGNNVFNFNPGDLYLFAPGLSHCFYNAKENLKSRKKSHAVVIQFRPDFLGSEIWNKIESLKISRLLKKSDAGLYFKKFDADVLAHVNNIRSLKGLLRLTELLALLDQLASIRNVIRLKNIHTDESLFDDSVSKKISSVYKYVAENFQKDITFGKAASLANMQKAAFCRYFKRKTQKKFSAFVNEIRVTHARKLLTETDKTVLEICYDCGYKSLSYFNHQFKIITNTTPLSYRSAFSVE